MSWYFLRPQGPLLIGDGRTYGGSFHRGSVFPPPQAVLGAVRARAGEALNFGWDFSSADDEVRRVVGTQQAPGTLRVRGVFFATRRDRQPPELYFPRPADLVMFPPPQSTGEKGAPSWHPLRPVQADGSCVSAPGDLNEALAPLGHLAPPAGRKPAPDPPAFLGLGPFLNHLRDRSSAQSSFTAEPGPIADPRVHVVIDNGTLAAAEGGLFSEGRLSFDRPLRDSREAGIAVELEGDAGIALSGTWRLGGKGSLVAAEPVEPDVQSLDVLRTAALAAIAAAGGQLRWVLVTPARFRHGWLPDFLDGTGEGVLPGTDVRVRLKSAAVDRAFAYSGWDLAGKGPSQGRARGAPRPTRLFVPAGSVYFFEVTDGGGDAARRAAEAAWLQSLVPIDTGEHNQEAWKRAAAIDAACGLARGVFGPWDWHQRSEDQE